MQKPNRTSLIIITFTKRFTKFKMENPLKIKARYQHFELNVDITSQIMNRARFALYRFGNETGHLQENNTPF